MIATVKIAPIQQWCPSNLSDLQRYPEGHRLVGMQVQIITESMSMSGDCQIPLELSGHKVWQITKSSREAIKEKLGWPSIEEDFQICEHMLEMD